MAIIGKVVAFKQLVNLRDEVQTHIKLRYKKAHDEMFNKHHVSQKSLSEAEYRLLSKVLPDALRDLPPPSEFLV